MEFNCLYASDILLEIEGEEVSHKGVYYTLFKQEHHSFRWGSRNLIISTFTTKNVRSDLLSDTFKIRLTSVAFTMKTSTITVCQFLLKRPYPHAHVLRPKSNLVTFLLVTF